MMAVARPPSSDDGGNNKVVAMTGLTVKHSCGDRDSRIQRPMANLAFPRLDLAVFFFGGGGAMTTAPSPSMAMATATLYVSL